MYILFKSVFVGIAYIAVLLYVFVKNVTVGYFDRILVMYPLYYCIMILPTVHQIYVYNVVERMIPKWTYLPRALFHYTLYYPDLTKSFPAVLCVIMIMIWKDICFLISHAEKRLAKIETSMYDEDIEQRVAHLHLNVYADDTENRFHKHCFDTNRLYMLQNTEQSKDALLSIYNYRKLRREGKQPREFTGDDKIYYEASNNRKMFISQRWSFMVTPLLILLWLMLMTDHQPQLLMYIHYGCLAVDVSTYSLGNRANDIFTDFTYLASSLILVSGTARHYK